MKTYKEFPIGSRRELLERYWVTWEDLDYLSINSNYENIRLLEWQDFTNDNIKFMCVYWDPETIKEYLDYIK